MIQKKVQIFLMFFFLFMLPFGLMAQTINGKVTDKSGITLPYMNVVEKGTKNGTTTNNSGEFSLTVKKIPTTFVVSALGFMSLEVKVSSKTYLTVVVEEDNVSLDEIVVVGSRGKPRTVFDSPVPIDNIKISELAQTGKGVLDQQLMFKVPSYNSTQQPISDAAAHFSPADLRGLFPSRTLVLVNGKRKNASALVYSYVTPGRGEVGVDMKSIPSAAL